MGDSTRGKKLKNTWSVAIYSEMTCIAETATANVRPAQGPGVDGAAALALPLSSPDRLRALERLMLMDTPGETAFDRLTRLASQALGVPVSLVSLVDDHRQFFKSAHGLGGWAGEARQMPLSHSFCQHVVTSDAALVVDDARTHPLVRNNLAVSELGVAAYLGVPLHSPEGYVVGTFCAIAPEARTWTERDQAMLGELREVVEEEFRRRRDAEAAEAAEARQRALMDATTLSIISVLPTGRIESANTGAARLLGYPLEELMGQDLARLAHVPAELEARAAWLSTELGKAVAPGFEALVTATRLGRMEEREWTFQRKDRSLVPVLVTITAMRSPGGELVGYLSVAKDLTVRHSAEAEVRASRKRLASIFSSLTEGVVLQNSTGEILECNQAAEKILGVTTDQLRGLSSKDSRWRTVREDGAPFPPEDHPGMVTLRTGQPQRDVIIGVHKADGALTWISVNSEPVIDSDGVMRTVVTSFSDITARKTVQVELAQSRQLLQTITDILPGMVGYWTVDLRCAFANPAHRAWFGGDPERMRGLHLKEVVGPELFARIEEPVRGVLAGQPQRFERDVRRADGTLAYTWGHFVPDFAPDGKTVRGFVALVTDITERKRLEQQLALARDEAVESSRLKSEFLATMSHEIRTPMNAILGMAGLLADTPLTGSQHDMLRTVLGGAESLLAIINDILDFSRIEAGKLRLDDVDFDCRRVVEEAVTLLTPLAQEKRLGLSWEFSQPPTNQLRGDGGRLRQILMNLVGNAVKFTDEGAVHVTASGMNIGGGRYRVRVTVRDTGVGIPEAVQQRLFQPFMQADGSTTRRFGGTGLGLAISRQLALAMGGKIGFESTPGQGSKFWIELPFASGGPLMAPRAAGVEHAEGHTATGGPAVVRRVLLTEDNRPNQMVASMILKKLGYTVDIADDGAKALDRLARERYDVVLMDCQMPVMDGFEATRRIRAGDIPGIDARVPIIALTAFARAEDREKCLAAGMNRYVSKPVRMLELKAALEACVPLLDGHSGATGAVG